MPIESLNHFTLLTDDVEATVRFYGDVLDLHPGARPALAVPGVWLYADRDPLVHVVGGRPKSDLKPGVLDHMAFTAHGLAPTLERLRAHEVPHTVRQIPGLGTWQVFFADPNGAKIELDFDSNERA